MDLRESVLRAQNEGVPIAQIAREARLSRQGVYDLLAAVLSPPPYGRRSHHGVGTGITVPLGVVCDGALFGSPAILKIEYRYVRGL